MRLVALRRHRNYNLCLRGGNCILQKEKGLINSKIRPREIAGELFLYNVVYYDRRNEYCKTDMRKNKVWFVCDGRAKLFFDRADFCEL